MQISVQIGLNWNWSTGTELGNKKNQKRHGRSKSMNGVHFGGNFQVSVIEEVALFHVYELLWTSSSSMPPSPQKIATPL